MSIFDWADTITTTPASALGAGSTPDGPLLSGETGAAGGSAQVQPVSGDNNGSPVMPAVPVLSFVVHGQPAPQGSKRGYVVNGRAVMVESSKKVKPWREAVKHAALDVLGVSDWQPPRGVPLMLTVVYTLPRPKSHYRTGRNAHLLRDNAPRWPASKPDVGKLTRATEDALGDAGVYGDDAQICVSLSVKSYPDVHTRAMAGPGAYIRITVLPLSPTKDV